MCVSVAAGDRIHLLCVGHTLKHHLYVHLLWMVHSDTPVMDHNSPSISRTLAQFVVHRMPSGSHPLTISPYQIKTQAFVLLFLCALVIC